jgi:hypothetical protein
VLTTDQKGAIAEAAIALEAINLGVGVFKPITVERYDLIFDLRHALLRVQCKWAVRRGDVVTVRCCSARRAPEGFRKRAYSSEEVDALAAYCAELGRCYLLPLEEFAHQREITLRLSPPLNNQRVKINWAENYEFAATLGRHQGAIAQLGERQRGTLEVAGSSPAGSTLFESADEAWQALRLDAS